MARNNYSIIHATLANSFDRCKVKKKTPNLRLSHNYIVCLFRILALSAVDVSLRLILYIVAACIQALVA